MNLLLNVAIFDSYLTDIVMKNLREMHPNRTITSVDVLFQIVKDDQSQIMKKLLETAEVDKEIFISALEEFTETYSEIQYGTFSSDESSQFSTKFRDASGILRNYLHFAKVLSKMQGKQLTTCEEYLRSFFKNPPLEFMYFLEEEGFLTSTDLHRFFSDYEKNMRKPLTRETLKCG